MPQRGRDSGLQRGATGELALVGERLRGISAPPGVCLDDAGATSRSMSLRFLRAVDEGGGGEAVEVAHRAHSGLVKPHARLVGFAGLRRLTKAWTVPG